MNIAIASGKGGTGKTFVSTNLFKTFQSLGHSALLVDCDVECPNSLLFFDLKKLSDTIVKEYRPIIDTNKCVYCGLCYEYCEYNAIFYVPELKQIKLLDNLCHGCKACTVACKHGAIENSSTEIGQVSFFVDSEKHIFLEGRLKEGKIASIPIIKSTIKEALSLSSDFVLIDSSPGTSCPFIQTAVRSDYIVLVTEPTPFGLSDLKQAVETLDSINKNYGVIINRSGIGNIEVYDYLEKNKIPIIAEIPFSKEIARYYSEGKLAVSYLSEIKELFEEISNKIIKNGNSIS
ncbi:MAG: ATP-binding protein [Bacteroidales bacterium]|nr:ATP-binding protein [Bacteroidales bacterium]